MIAFKCRTRPKTTQGSPPGAGWKELERDSTPLSVVVIFVVVVVVVAVACCRRVLLVTTSVNGFFLSFV